MHYRSLARSALLLCCLLSMSAFNAFLFICVVLLCLTIGALLKKHRFATSSPRPLPSKRQSAAHIPSSAAAIKATGRSRESVLLTAEEVDGECKITNPHSTAHLSATLFIDEQGVSELVLPGDFAVHLGLLPLRNSANSNMYTLSPRVLVKRVCKQNGRSTAEALLECEVDRDEYYTAVRAAAPEKAAAPPSTSKPRMVIRLSPILLISARAAAKLGC